MIKETFAERLRKVRLIRGYTQEYMSKKINVTRSAYSYYESGKCEPDLKNLRKIAIILQISLNYLITGEIKKSE